MWSRSKIHPGEPSRWNNTSMFCLLDFYHPPAVTTHITHLYIYYILIWSYIFFMCYNPLCCCVKLNFPCGESMKGKSYLIPLLSPPLSEGRLWYRTKSTRIQEEEENIVSCFVEQSLLTRNKNPAYVCLQRLLKMILQAQSSCVIKVHCVLQSQISKPRPEPPFL